MSGQPVTPPDPFDLLREAARLADDKKAVDIAGLDLRGLANFTDCFLICTGGTERQVKAIHDSVREGIKERFGILPDRTEGENDRAWLLLDYGDCVVHIMQPDVRGYYSLEDLWRDAKRIDFGLSDPPVQPAAHSVAAQSSER
jgi:ribosome-associated protein